MINMLVVGDMNTHVNSAKDGDHDFPVHTLTGLLPCIFCPFIAIWLWKCVLASYVRLLIRTIITRKDLGTQVRFD